MASDGFTRGNANWLRQINEDRKIHVHFRQLWVLVDGFVNRAIFNGHGIRLAWPTPEEWARASGVKTRTIQYAVEAARERGHLRTIRRGPGRATAYVLILNNAQDGAPLEDKEIRNILRLFMIKRRSPTHEEVHSITKRDATAMEEAPENSTAC
jgi:hypothetical protein